MFFKINGQYFFQSRKKQRSPRVLFSHHSSEVSFSLTEITDCPDLKIHFFCLCAPGWNRRTRKSGPGPDCAGTGGCLHLLQEAQEESGWATFSMRNCWLSFVHLSMCIFGSSQRICSPNSGLMERGEDFM
jgi:hypothetical protein